jgi:2'-5' RNA ligase
LFFALLPPLDVAEEIAWLRDDGGCRASPVGRRRFHVTLLMLGDFSFLPRGLFARIDAILAIETVRPCRLVFDTLVRGAHSTLLLPSEPLLGAVRLRESLAALLVRGGMGRAGRRGFSPHVTLHYDPEPGGMEPIDAISWRADTLVLIESQIGRGRHVLRGRWGLTQSLKPIAAPASR